MSSSGLGSAKTSSGVSGSSSSTTLITSPCCSLSQTHGIPSTLQVTLSGDFEWSGSIDYIGRIDSGELTWEGSFISGGNAWTIRVLLGEYEDACVLGFGFKCAADPPETPFTAGVFPVIFDCDVIDYTTSDYFQSTYCGEKTYVISVNG